MFLKNLKNRSVSGLFNSFMDEINNYDYIPTNFIGKTTNESGVDKDGYTWYKTNFTSHDGTYTHTSTVKTKTTNKLVNLSLNNDTWFDEAIEKFNTMNAFNEQRKDVTSTKAGKAANDRLNILQDELDVAIKNQKFEEAAKLKNEIDSIEDTKVELTMLKAELKTLVETHNFEKAIEVRDKINAIENK